MYLALPNGAHIDVNTPPADITGLWVCTVPTKKVAITGSFIEESGISREMFEAEVTNGSFQLYEFDTVPVVKVYDVQLGAWKEIDIGDSEVNFSLLDYGKLGSFILA